MTASISWMSVSEAARVLGSDVVTLRRAIERNARRTPAGVVESSFDGVLAQKLSNRWKVRLDPAWLRPAGP